MADNKQELYTLQELKNRINPEFTGPNIAYCPDWRIIKNDDGTENLGYIKSFVDKFHKIFEETLGAQIHYLCYEELLSESSCKFDGCLISGGRDIDPELYNEPNKGTDVDHKRASHLRWNWCKDLFFNSDKNIPVFAICYGFQVINCLFGGTLKQNIQKEEFHKDCMSKIEIDKNSKLYRALGGENIITGKCYHTQGLKDIPEEFGVVARTPKDQMPHGIEWKGDDRKILAVLWHPELMQDSTGQFESTNFGVFKNFVGQCEEYRTRRVLYREI